MKYIPINKGNYSSMETPEREARFERIRAENWENEYKEYRRKWSELALSQSVSPYPLQVDAELSNICNLKCPMCFRSVEEYNKKENVVFMEYDLFKKIIDEIGGKVPALRLSLRGESTLHPRIIDCIEYAKKGGIKEISFLTNGGKLSGEFFEELLLAGVDWITISVDGMYETYEKIRKPLKFSETLSRIKAANEIKKKHGTNRPVIKIQSIWPAIRDNPEEFYNTFRPYADLVAFNPLIDYLGADDEKFIEYIDEFSCPQIYERLVIGADGIAAMCTNDEENLQYIGDARKQTIHEIWHSAELNAVRETHKEKGGFKKLAVCRKCFLPRKTEDVEEALVNGRKVKILNYVNRIQIVGK